MIGNGSQLVSQHLGILQWRTIQEDRQETTLIPLSLWSELFRPYAILARIL